MLPRTPPNVLKCCQTSSDSSNNMPVGQETSIADATTYNKHACFEACHKSTIWQPCGGTCEGIFLGLPMLRRLLRKRWMCQQYIQSVLHAMMTWIFITSPDYLKPTRETLSWTIETWWVVANHSGSFQDAVLLFWLLWLQNLIIARSPEASSR